MSPPCALPCTLCGSEHFETIFTYTKPPRDEVHFTLPPGTTYYRTVDKCAGCGLFVSHHDIDLSGLYSGEYVDATYGNTGIETTFNKIINLPPEKSDNVGRVSRMNEFCADYFGHNNFSSLKVLDIGSGLGVFPYAMKAAGWCCTALDPDTRAAEHARSVVGVDAVHADFFKAELNEKFDLITFNKVLEHVSDPTAMLVRSKTFLAEGGLVYIELPDGEMAQHDGADREEFCIDHLYVFGMASLLLLAKSADFTVLRCARLREPSSKYTMYAYLKL